MLVKNKKKVFLSGLVSKFWLFQSKFEWGTKPKREREKSSNVCSSNEPENGRIEKKLDHFMNLFKTAARYCPSFGAWTNVRDHLGFKRNYKNEREREIEIFFNETRHSSLHVLPFEFFFCHMQWKKFSVFFSRISWDDGTALIFIYLFYFKKKED